MKKKALAFMLAATTTLTFALAGCGVTTTGTTETTGSTTSDATTETATTAEATAATTYNPGGHI